MAMLQDEIIIKGVRIRNRLALPPLTTNYGGPEGIITDAVTQFYKERSKDVGLVIVEATSVRPDGLIVPGTLGLWEDSQIPGMKRLADTIKGLGAAAVLQLNHAGARCYPGGGKMQGASPSGVPLNPAVEPFAMTQEQIDEMVLDFASAARRAVEAGFDGIEIHGAHLYLISQFLSPFTNKRTDRYGGDARGRATFVLEILKAVREKVPDSYPVFFRNPQPRLDLLPGQQLLTPQLRQTTPETFQGYAGPATQPHRCPMPPTHIQISLQNNPLKAAFLPDRLDPLAQDTRQPCSSSPQPKNNHPLLCSPPTLCTALLV